MKAAIIGVGGFIGRALAAELAGRGAEVVGYGRAARIEGAACGHVTRYVSCDAAQGGFDFPADLDVVYYLAQSGHYHAFPRHASDVLAVNALGAVRALEEAQERAALFVYASTGSVYAPSFAPLAESMPLRRDKGYALSKVIAEELLRLASFDVDTVAARLFGVFGPGQGDMLPARLIARVAEGQPVLLRPKTAPARPDTGGLRVSFTYLGDACAMLADLAERRAAGDTLPRELNIAGPKAHSLREFCDAAAALLGRGARYEVADAPRDCDLIADVSLLGSLITPTHTDLDAALARTLAATPGAGR